MDLSKIKTVIESGLPPEYQKSTILKIISEDQNSLKYMLQMLEFERKERKELIIDMNLELSRADVCIEKDGKMPEKSFVLEEIGKFYNKYKGLVGHCFNKYREDKKELPNNKYLQ